MVSLRCALPARVIVSAIFAQQMVCAIIFYIPTMFKGLFLQLDRRCFSGEKKMMSAMTEKIVGVLEMKRSI